jgi:hypothetical protein
MRLSPDIDWITQLLSTNFLAGNALTTYAHALLNTVPFPLDPLPSWFAQLNTDLQSAQAAAQRWVDTDAPAVAAGLPQAWIDYADLFIPTAQALITRVAQVEQNPGRTPTDAQRQELLQLLDQLSSKAQAQLTAVTALRERLNSFAEQVEAQRGALTNDIKAADATLSDDEAQVLQLRDQLAQLQAKVSAIAEDVKNSFNSAATSGATFSFTILSYSVDAIIAGAAFPVFGIAGGILAITFAAVQEALEDRALLKDLQDLSAAQVMLTAEQQQIAALQGIIGSLTRLRDQNLQVNQSGGGIVPTWEYIEGQVQSVMEALQQPNVDISLISPLNTLADAVKDWQTIVTRATNVQNSSLTQTQTVSLNSLIKPATMQSVV